MTTTEEIFHIFLFTICVILTLYHFWFQSLRSTKLGNKLPGPYPLPIIGNTHDAFRGLWKNPTSIMQTALEYAASYDKIIRFWFGSRLGVLLLDPRDIELILGSSIHLEKSLDYSFFEPWLGDGLLISKGEKWHSHRKMIAPTFHQSILKTFLPVFNQNANKLVEHLRRNVLGKVCDIHDYMCETTVDNLLETVMGVNKTKESQSSYKYAKAAMDMCGIIQKRHILIWLRSDFIFRITKLFKKQKQLLKIINNLSERVISEKKKDYFNRLQKGDIISFSSTEKETEKQANRNFTGKREFIYGSALRDDLDINDEILGQKKRLAFLDFMVEACQTETNKLNDKDIKDEVNTIMFEGHDTVAAASSFFICILGVYPEIQEKVYQELENIFQGSDRPISFNDTLEMKYLERVLLETLRLYPPVPLITRILREEIKLASADYILPKGCSVGVAQFLVHRDPEHYPNPTKFDPDNFLPERCQTRHFYSFIPFSAGPRSCVGRKYAMLNLKILLAEIVRNFKITSAVPEKDFALQGDIILKRADGFRVVLEDRKHLNTP